MSQHSTTRTSSSLRRGLVALATSAALLAGGLVVAPSAQATPVVDVHRSQGTTVRTSLSASGSTITGDVKRQKLDPARFGYTVILEASGGTMLGSEVQVTLQKIDRTPVRKRTVVLDRTSSTRMARHGAINFTGTIAPGTYRVGVEVFTVIRKADGTRVRHVIDVDEAQRVQFKRAVSVDATISTDAKDGRPARITARARVLRVADDGSISWLTIRSGRAILSADPDGPWGDKPAKFVRDLTIRDGRISTDVTTRPGYWKVTYPGTARYARSTGWLPELCGC